MFVDHHTPRGLAARTVCEFIPRTASSGATKEPNHHGMLPFRTTRSLGCTNRWSTSASELACVPHD